MRLNHDPQEGSDNMDKRDKSEDRLILEELEGDEFDTTDYRVVMGDDEG
jgi:hypothetical protein